MDVHIRKLPGSNTEEEFYLVSDVRELETARDKLAAETDELFNDAMVMALRLYGEDPQTFGPECWDVMQKWGPKVKAILDSNRIRARDMNHTAERKEGR